MAVSVIEPWRSRKIFGYFAGLSFEAAIRGADFQVIDLRWVIQATRSPDEVLQRCLELVEETFPFFVCVIGDNYGLVPAGADRSATHLEVARFLERGHFKWRLNGCSEASGRTNSWTCPAKI